jgi:hypothetical protein
MSEMSERIAKTMWEYWFCSDWPPKRMADLDMDAENFREVAHKVLAEMREPTEEMLNAVSWTEGVGDGGWTERAPFPKEYTAAIDAALEEYKHTENATPVEVISPPSLSPVDDMTRATYQRMIAAMLKRD